MKKKKIKIIICIAAVVLAAVIAFFAVKFADKEHVATNTSAEEETNERILKEGGLELSDIFSYSGEFVEDGSNDEKENICAITIKNNSSADWQYINLCITTDRGELYFEATTLLAYTEITVLEKNAAPFEEGMEVISTEYINKAEFTETPSVHSELFNLTAVDGVINIENISDNDITGDIYLYYKTVCAGGFFGGITFRSKIEGGIKAGEIKQLSASHFAAETSKVIFVTYAE